jgi:hypothetical protein
VSIQKWPFLPCSAFSAGLRLRLEKRPGCGVQAYASMSRVRGAQTLVRPLSEQKLLIFELDTYRVDPELRDITETFEKCSILFKAKEGENFNHRHTFSISRIKI